MIWFDLDDTLTDFRSASHIALSTIYADLRLDEIFPTVELWLDTYHRHNAALWERFNREEITGDFLRTERFRLTLAEQALGDFDPALPQALSNSYLYHLAENATAIPGAVRALRIVHAAGMKAGVLTNGFAGVQERKLQVAGLADKVDCVVVSDRVGANKPSPRIFRIAAEMAGSTVNVMVGDNPATDIAGALAAGWGAVLFDPSGSHPDFNGPKAPTLSKAALLAIDIAKKSSSKTLLLLSPPT